MKLEYTYFIVNLKYNTPSKTQSKLIVHILRFSWVIDTPTSASGSLFVTLYTLYYIDYVLSGEVSGNDNYTTAGKLGKTTSICLIF